MRMEKYNIPMNTKNLARRFECIRDQQIPLTEEVLRDYIQLHDGLSSLEASPASLSTQVEWEVLWLILEYLIHTFLVTVLAIFFVPTSLGTSIFGMNINELNGNGQALWVFITTIALIVVVTLMDDMGFHVPISKVQYAPKRPLQARVEALANEISMLSAAYLPRTDYLGLEIWDHPLPRLLCL
ncbi:hypothetical protein GGR53DRAFT_64597 [Hypoxylon sp. FL1150]|nr:hypothetical protein GGR53DRAFT_64597 [Hypoxylon sp. FL1150]